MSIFGSFFGIGGPGNLRTNTDIYGTAGGNANLDVAMGNTAQAIEQYGQATGGLLAAGTGGNMPSTWDDLSSENGAAIYRAVDPTNPDANDISGYVSDLSNSLYDTDLTSAQSMADRARYAELFGGV